MKRNWAKDPSILTKDRLKTILASNGVILPDGDQRKDVYVKLYLQHIQNVKPDVRNKDHSGKSEFSSDDDTESASKSARKRKSIRKRKGIDKSSALNVDSLSDEELLKNLKKYDDGVGPVIDSTRDLYKRKLKSYVQESEVAVNQEFSDQEGTTDSTNRKEVTNSSTPRRGRAKGRRSVSRNEIIIPDVNDSAIAGSRIDAAADVPNIPHSSTSSQQGLESVQKPNLQETSLWYFIIVLVMILAIFTGALMQKIDRSISP